MTSGWICLSRVLHNSTSYHRGVLNFVFSSKYQPDLKIALLLFGVLFEYCCTTSLRMNNVTLLASVVYTLHAVLQPVEYMVLREMSNRSCFEVCFNLYCCCLLLPL